MAWARELQPQEIPVKIAKSETGLATVPGVALLEIRKREGKEVWTPVDHGTVYLTDRQAIFSGSKNVKFQYDKLLDQEVTANGLYLNVSSRKKPHMLSGPAEKVSALITASEAVGHGEEATTPYEAKAENFRYTVADTERDLDRLREERQALVVPPRPTSPAWVPLTALFLLLFVGAALADPSSPDPIAAADTTTTSAATTVEETTTTEQTTTTSVRSTTTEPPTTTTFPQVDQADVIFAPPAPGASGDPSDAPPSGAELVTVASVTDGDTLDVRFDDGSTDTVRLIGINSPESNECWGTEASLALAALTPVGSEIGMTSDVSDRDQFDRLLRYLWVGGMSVNEEMIRRGAAIARRYPPDTAMASRLEAAQAEAKEKQIGLWAPDACGPAADADLRISEVFYDAPGNDNENLNGEYIRIRNRGDNLVDMTGWGVKDESASNRYNFPDGFTLSPDETVTIRTGCGDDFGTELFWCSVGSAVWNNDGDTVFLLDSNGNTHTSRTYAPTTTTTSSTTTTTSATTTSTTSGGGNCDPSYPDVCIPPYPPDLDCGDISYRRFTVVGSDPHGFDRDNDGIGCES